jgi:hypothetical protein
LRKQGFFIAALVIAALVIAALVITELVIAEQSIDTPLFVDAQ